jgi:hypothetical protein
MRTPSDRIPPEESLDFPSYERATWRDTNGRENKRFHVRPMQNGSGGFEILDTDNDADFVVQSDFRTIQDAEGVDASASCSLARSALFSC